jgi:hypothetical protein
VPPVVGSTTVVPDVLVTGAANTALTASTERVSVDLNVSATQTWAAGTVATERTVLVRAPTLGGSAATATFTDAATLAITGPPIETTNAAVTNAYALLIQGGAATGATNGYGLKVIAPTGAGTNFAAIFTGGNVGILSTNPTSPLSVGAADQFQVTSGGNISVLNGVGFYTWPTALPSANGQVLTGQTSGTLSWAAPAMDPTTTAELYEEFASGSYPAMDGTSHDIAKLGWMGLQSGTCAARQATAVAGAPGLLELLVDAVTSDYCLLVLNSASAQKFVVGYQSSNTWTAKFRLQHTSTTNTAIVAGFGTSNIVTPANHVDFFGIRYDTALSDTNYMCVSRASAVTTTTSTGVAASTGFHRFTLSRVANGTGTCAQGAGCLQCQVDAAAAVQTNAAMPTVAVDALTGIITRTNAEESLILDYFTYRDTGLSR